MQLDLETSYRLVREAARNRRFLSYVDLANASNMSWGKARHLIGRHLGKLNEAAHLRGWPLIAAIVVPGSNVRDGEFGGYALKGFIDLARKLGMNVPEGAEDAFRRTEQQRVFEWAGTAPEELGIENLPIAIEAGQNSATDPLADSDRQFWLASAHWREGNQTDRFIEEGIWQAAPTLAARIRNYMNRMRPGDRIAIKRTSNRRTGLPFKSHGRPASVMQILAVGEITGPVGADGRTVPVNWTRMNPPKEWFLNTYMGAISRINRNDPMGEELIRFAFAGGEQDLARYLRHPFWAHRFGPSASPPLDDEVASPCSSPNLEPDTDSRRGYTVNDLIEDGCFLHRERLEAMLELWRRRKNLILQGAPGTGKTWLAKRLARALVGLREPDPDKLFACQFHPGLSYEDFVRGWRPRGDGRLELVDGLFLRAVQAAQAQPDVPIVLVIEEINRGSPAQILGEMLTLLEAGKRARSEALALSYPRQLQERIFVPENLYVIGTMNIADRSLALVDFALRRRFAFETLEPSFNVPWRQWCARHGVSEDVLDRIAETMAQLNEHIASNASLGRPFQIGHSFVTPDETIEDGTGWFDSVINTELVPLVEEYGFDQRDWVTRAKAILGRA